MNARAFREAVEKSLLDERQKRLSDKGAALPKDTRAPNGEGEHRTRAELAAGRKAEREARIKAVARCIEAGLTLQEICTELNITERQYFWNRQKVKQAESSRGVVTR